MVLALAFHRRGHNGRAGILLLVLMAVLLKLFLVLLLTHFLAAFLDD